MNRWKRDETDGETDLLLMNGNGALANCTIALLAFAVAALRPIQTGVFFDSFFPIFGVFSL